MPDNTIEMNSTASILFVGNSFTFGRVDPVMSYNTENVRDLTAPVPGTSFEDTTGSNVFEPHPWGGVPGIFEAFTDQVGLDYDVAISTRNAASLQGHYLNSSPAGWDLRGNVASQSWDTLILQDNSSRPLPSGSGTITFAPGETVARLILDPTADAKLETDETVSVTLAEGAGYRVGTTGEIIGTILDDDESTPVIDPSLPTVTLAASPSAVQEDGSENLVYTFTRTGPTTEPLTIDFLADRDGSTAPSVNTSTGDFENFVSQFRTSFTANGAQTEGNLSFTSGGGSVVIPAGASSATFTLEPRADTDLESDEAMRLTLADNDAYNVGTPGPISATIQNDDLDPGTDPSVSSVSLGLSSATVYEDGSGNLVYEFQRTGSAADALTVGFEVGGTGTLPSEDFSVAGADSFTTGGAENPDLEAFNIYAVKLAEYATSGTADGEIPANPNANAATDVFLYETWARPNLVVGAREASTDEETGDVTTYETHAPEYYLSLEDMTDDLRDAYRGLAEANPIFEGVAPVGEAFMLAVQRGVATRDPYASDAGTDGRVDLWWDDNLHASKYGSYLSGLTLFGTITGVDPRALGAGDRAASDLGITGAEAAALQEIAAATLGLSLDAHWTAPAQVTEVEGGTGLLATAGAFGFSDSDTAESHTVEVTPLTPDALGSLTAEIHTDSTGDGTGGAVNWTYTVENAAATVLAPGETRVERFLLTVTDGGGDSSTREIEVTLNGTSDGPPTVTSGDGADSVTISVPEGETEVTTVVATDPEGAALTYSIAGGADAAAFAIDAETGALSFNAAPDYEQPTDAGGDNVYDVVVQASDGNAADTQSISVEVTDAADSTIIGQPGQAVVSGTPGNDTIIIGATNLTVSAGAGDDTISLLPGAVARGRSLDGGAGTDTVDLSATASDNTIDLLAGRISGSEIGRASLNSIENAIGGSGDDRIKGDQGANALTGGEGGDRLDGHHGADSLDGGAGDDLLSGGQGADSLSGGEGADTIRGDQGDDLIRGLGDGDRLDGGQGADTFVFTDELSNGEASELYVLDYDSVDTIEIGDASITSVTEDAGAIRVEIGDDADILVFQGVSSFDDLQFA